VVTFAAWAAYVGCRCDRRSGAARACAGAGHGRKRPSLAAAQREREESHALPQHATHGRAASRPVRLMRPVRGVPWVACVRFSRVCGSRIGVGVCRVSVVMCAVGWEWGWVVELAVDTLVDEQEEDRMDAIAARGRLVRLHVVHATPRRWIKPGYLPAARRSVGWRVVGRRRRSWTMTSRPAFGRRAWNRPSPGDVVSGRCSLRATYVLRVLAAGFFPAGVCACVRCAVRGVVGACGGL
jgi:hypothetical protein